MPHIHTEPGQVDFVVETFIVHVPTKRVLFRFHDKYREWCAPGGHLELNEFPEEAVRREAKEEVGLDIAVYDRRKPFRRKTGCYEELIPPEYMNSCFNSMTPEHRHVNLIFFATSESDRIQEPDNHEKSGGCLWLTKEELQTHPDIDDANKFYGTKALEVLVK